MEQSLSLACTTSRKPHFDGRRLTRWFRSLPLTYVRPSPAGSQHIGQGPWRRFHNRIYGSTNQAEAQASLFAVEKIGTNGLPFLLSKLAATDSLSQRLSDRICEKVGLNWRPFRACDVERAQAITGLLHRDFYPMWALDELARLTNSSNPQIAAAAHFVLTSFRSGTRFW